MGSGADPQLDQPLQKIACPLGEEASQLPSLPATGRFLDYLQANLIFRMSTKEYLILQEFVPTPPIV